MKEPFVDTGLIASVHAIWDLAEDRLVELAMYQHLVIWRAWNGERKGWTLFPIEWWGKENGIGFRRAKKALEHLMETGLVQSHPNNELGKKRKTGYYRALVLDKGEKLQKVAPPPNPNEVAKAQLARTPKVADDDAVVWVVDWDFRLQWPIEELRPLTYGAALLECKICGARYARDTGRWDEDEAVCVMCGLRTAVQQNAEVFYHLGAEYPMSDVFRKLVA